MASYKRSAWLMCLSAGVALSMAGSVLAQNDRKKDVKPTTAPPTSTPAKPETTKAQPPTDVKGGISDAEMAAMMAAAEPGESHKFLEKFEGKWTGTVKHWMAPGQTPSESTTTGKQKMELGGRYLYSTFEGDMGPEMGGAKFHGHGIMGYNNSLKKFQSSWVDNMGTGVEYNQGTLDASGKTLTLSGDMTNPRGAGTVKARWVLKWTGDNTYVEELYMPDSDGKEFKTMELSFKRTGKSEAGTHDGDKPEGKDKDKAKDKSRGN